VVGAATYLARNAFASSRPEAAAAEVSAGAEEDAASEDAGAELVSLGVELLLQAASARTDAATATIESDFFMHDLFSGWGDGVVPSNESQRRVM